MFLTLPMTKAEGYTHGFVESWIYKIKFSKIIKNINKLFRYQIPIIHKNKYVLEYFSQDETDNLQQ